MKKLFMAIAILSTSFFVTSCSNGGSSDPKAVLVNFFDALGKKDIDGARKLATAESKSMLDMMEMGLKMAKDGEGKVDEKYDKSRMEFGEAKIEADKATVPVKDKKSGETTNFTLKKEAGAWKVAFDKTSMMQMGADKMKENGTEGIDSLMDKGMDEMKNINIDSLKGAIDQELKAADSALKK